MISTVSTFFVNPYNNHVLIGNYFSVSDNIHFIIGLNHDCKSFTTYPFDNPIIFYRGKVSCCKRYSALCNSCLYNIVSTTSREIIALECIDWLWNKDVKIVSVLDDGIFYGEPNVD